MIIIIELVLLSLALAAQAFYWHDAANGTVKWTDNCDFYGAHIGSRRSRGEDCAALCYQEQGCTRFAWNHHDGGTCWFKNGDGGAFYVSNGGSCGYVFRKKKTSRPTATTLQRPMATIRRQRQERLLKTRSEMLTDNLCKTKSECYDDRQRYNL